MSNTGMHGSRYWTDGDWEYAFLQATGDTSPASVLYVLSHCGSPIYVQDADSDEEWIMARDLRRMPKLSEYEGRTGWTLSSEKNIFSGTGVLANLEEKLKTGECNCSFMVINDEPEKETERNSEVDLETENSGQPSLDETPQQTDEVEKKSGRKKKKKKQKSKKSTKVKVGQGIQTKMINSLKDRKKSQEASKKHDLIPYKVVSANNNTDAKAAKLAWKKIGNFIKNHPEIYGDVKPIGYGTRKHWHNWHKSWVGKVFVQEDEKRFWLMKLTDDLAAKLAQNLNGLDFTIEKYTAENSLGMTPIISNESKPENTEVNSSGETETAAEEPTGNRTTNVIKTTPNRKPPKPQNNDEEVTATSQQISENIERGEKKPLPEKSKSSTSKPESELKNDFLKDIRNGPKLKKTPTVTKQEINENSKNDLTSMLNKAMEIRREDIEDDENPEECDPNHEMMKIFKSLGEGIYIAMLQLTKPYDKVKEKLSSGALCPRGEGKMWLTNNKQGKYNQSSDIRDTIDEQTLEKCALASEDKPQGWYVKVITEIESDEWDDGGDEKNFLPSVTQMDALLAMQNDVSTKGARLVNISTPFPELKAVVKNPPTLPPRTAKPTPVPKGFATLDSLKPKTNNRHVKTLVLVNYDDIKKSKGLMMDLRRGKFEPNSKYKDFNVNNANKALSDFKNGTLIGANNLTAAKNYSNVLNNPVIDKYKDGTLYTVRLWNLEIPEDTSEGDEKKLRDELAKCGIAIRKDWRKSKV